MKYTILFDITHFISNNSIMERFWKCQQDRTWFEYGHQSFILSDYVIIPRLVMPNILDDLLFDDDFKCLLIKRWNHE